MSAQNRQGRPSSGQVPDNSNSGNDNSGNDNSGSGNSGSGADGRYFIATGPGQSFTAEGGRNGVSFVNSDAGVRVHVYDEFPQISQGYAAGASLTNIRNVIGSRFGDTLVGGGHDNILCGHDGNDTLVGEGGDDHLHGGNGIDGLVGGAGDDTLDGGAGDDTLNGGAGDDTLDGGAGHDRLYGWAGDDTLDGGAGDDTLNGGAGDDILDGGAGDDTLTGGAGIDELIGNDGNDTLYGGTGDDILDGGAGRNTLTGGAGGDTFILGGTRASFSEADTITDFGTGADRLGFDAAVSYVAYKVVDGDTQVITYSIDTGMVSYQAVLRGYTGGLTAAHLAPDTSRPLPVFVPDWIAADGPARVDGTGGADLVFGDAADNDIHGLGGDDALVGGAGDDTLAGGAGEDVLVGGAGDDTLTGGAGEDLLYGGAGDDVLAGGAGSDLIIAGAGDDMLVGGPGNDFLDGGAGNDTVSYEDAGEGVDVRLYIGLPGDDSLMNIENVTGSAYDDILFGDAGANILAGGGGGNSLTGGAGDDIFVLHSDRPRDTFDARPGDGPGLRADVITDFGTGADRLGFDAGVTHVAYKVVDGDTQVITYSIGTGMVSYQAVLRGYTGGLTAAHLAPDTSRPLPVFVPDWIAADGPARADGTGGADLVFGDAADNDIHGLGGDDVLVGGAGDDTLVGGAGDDILVGGVGADWLDGGDGVDTANYREGATEGVNVNLQRGYTSGHAQGDRLRSIENLAGTDFNDVLTGDAGTNVLRGYGGDDMLAGGAGRDILTGGAGNDIFRILHVAHESRHYGDIITDFEAGDRLALHLVKDPRISRIAIDRDTANNKTVLYHGELSRYSLIVELQDYLGPINNDIFTNSEQFTFEVI